MRVLFDFLKTTLLGGVFILLPAWLLILALIKSVGQLQKLVSPLSAQLPETYALPGLLAAALLLALCFVTGLLIRTAIGRYVRDAIETRILERVPGYGLLRGITAGFTGADSGQSLQPAFMESGENLVLAVVVERHGDHCTVFVPSAPAATSGSIQIVPAGKVHTLNVALTKALTCVTHYGSGYGDLLATADLASRK
jgi:uncharacterized membrane protein